jgi:hypothetical protein
MSLDFGIRISQPGKDVLTCTDPETIFSSKFDNLKIHSRGTGTIYDSTGRTITIAHGLGYVPAFIVHSQGDALFNTSYSHLSGKYMLSPIGVTVSDIGSPYYYNNRSTSVWADSTNIYIKVEDDYGKLYSTTDADQNNYGSEGLSYSNGWFTVGKSSGGTIYKGALRFENVAVSGSVYKAEIGIHINDGGSQTTPVKTWGIDEDDASDFASNPFGRTKTTAYVANSRDSGIGDDQTWVYGVTDIFNEILGRGGWSSGNHMAFIMEDNGSSVNDTEIATYYSWDSSGFPFYDGLSYIKWMTTDKLTDYRYTIFKNKLA